MLDSRNDWHGMSPSKKGALAELMACNWLLQQGYDVFKNVTPTGIIDIIAWKSGDFFFIDVACITYSKGKIQDSKSLKAKTGKEFNIKFLYVFSDGSCKWRHDIFSTEAVFIDCANCGNNFERHKKTKKCCSTVCTKEYTIKYHRTKAQLKKILKSEIITVT